MPHRALRGPLWTALTLLLLAAGPLHVARGEGDPPGFPGVRLVEAWPGVTFDLPLGMVRPSDGSDDLYVLEQGGRAKRLARWQGGQTPVPQPTVFLDLSDRVFPRAQGGLLGLAFHPRYAENGRVFAIYVRQVPAGGFEWVLSEFRAQGGVASAATERPILVIPKSTAMHNGGWAVFGADGSLFLSTGDNAKQKEALLTSQNPMSLLGKILRIDVDRTEGELPYAIPADNPWASYAQGVRREIWAYGMRNPWRFSFDGQGNLWTAEPGAKGPGTHEWVTKVQKGQNHGWPYFEGTRPLEPIPPELQAQAQGFVRPVFEYERGPEPDQTAAWGGYIYRGNRVPALRGRYVFGDYPRNSVYTIQPAGGPSADFRTLAKIPNVCAIGEDAQGELYFISLDTGKIYTLLAAS